MHARRPIRPHMAIKPKIVVSAGGKAFNSSIPIISSRELYSTEGPNRRQERGGSEWESIKILLEGD
jgi:hypothetical protein